jgi:hypothetical protein
MGRAVQAGAGALVAWGALIGCSVEGDLGGGAAPTPTPPCATPCDGACVDLSTNPAHCGACDVACGDGEACRAGVCAYPWPAQWVTTYVERFTTSPVPGWSWNSGICARPGVGAAPDGTPGWEFRPDWVQLRRRDPTPVDGYRAWVWRMWIGPPTDRTWNVTGCIRTRVTSENTTDGTGLCFRVGSANDGSANDGSVTWVADGSQVAANPGGATGRWMEFRWEVSPSNRRARARLDGVLAWEGAIDDAEWDDRPWWSVNVLRAGFYEGCNTGLFVLAEARGEVAAAR